MILAYCKLSFRKLHFSDLANIVMGILVCIVLASVLYPVVQVQLALLHFKIGHPWSKILIAKTSDFPKIHPFHLNDFDLM